MATSDTLRSVIDAGRSSKRLDELSSARVIGKVALQLHAAQQKAGHGKAVGPVTPAHIRLAPTGEATLELDGATALGYSSPEQIAGSPGDRRSDVFSLGAVLWEALTYARLFDAMNDTAVRIAVQEREIVAPADVNANVPAELSAICMRALSRNPADRYQSLKAMAVEIEEFLEEAGYEDSDAKIAQYLAAMAEPPKQVKIALAPLARPATATPAPPIDAAHVEKIVGTQPPPNVLKQPAAPAMLGEPPAQEPRAKTPSGVALAAALANAGQQIGQQGAASPNGTAGTAGTVGSVGAGASLPPALAASTAVGVPKLDDWQDAAPAPHAPPPAAAPIVPVDPAAPTSVASSANSSAVAVTPQPPVVPANAPAPRNDRQTIVAGSVPMPKAPVEAKHVEAKQPALIVDDKPPAVIVEDKPPAVIVDTPPPGKLETMTTLVDTKPPAIDVPKLVDGKLPAAEPPPAVAVEAKEAAPAARAASQPGSTRAGSQSDVARAASVVALPRAESKDVLAGWGWGTDKHNAIPPDGYGDDDYDVPEPNQKKTLMYVIGGGLVFAALVVIVAFAFGGSSDTKKAAAAQTTEEPTRPAIDQRAPAPEPAPAPAAEPAAETPTAAAAPATDPAPADGSAQAAVAAPSEAEQQAAAAAEQARVEAEHAEAAKAEAARLAAEQETAKKAEAARIAAEQEKAKKAEAARIAAEKKAEQQRLAAAKAEAKKAEQAKKTQAAKTAPKSLAKTTSKQPARPGSAKTGKVDAETAYRTGLQQFARGDTSGALASLRTALAANPSYAPTWRGLGLVFEKMGERDQARAAYRRYLQLAPSAGDAGQIRSRLERLGS